MEGLIKESADLVIWFILVPLAWFMKRLVGRVDIIDKEVADHRTKVAETYLPKDDARDNFAQINKKLDQIVEQLMKKGQE